MSFTRRLQPFAVLLFAFPSLATINRASRTNTGAGIQSALNSLASTTLDGRGGTVFLPEGTVNLGTTGLAIPTGVTLACESRDGCWLQYTGSGAAVSFRSVFHAGLRNVYIYLPSPVSGQTCIAVTGTPSNQSQDNLIEENSCFFGTTRGTIIAGTVGISLTGTSGPADVALNRVIGNSVTNAAAPVTLNDAEQNWLSENRIDWYIAPALTLGANAVANYGTFRIAGNGTTGSAVSVAGTKNHLYVWCDSGAAQCFNETGNSNYLEAVAFSGSGSIRAQGTIATNGGSFALWNGQSNQICTWSCLVNGTIQNSSAINWCRFTSTASITVVRIEAVSQGSAGSGCMTAPQIQFSNGSLSNNVGFTNGQSTVDSGAISGNYNAGTFQINTVAGSGCTSGWAGGTAVTIQYQIQ